jgi:hypothetical protein
MLSFDSGHIGFDLDSMAALGLIVPHFSLAIALGTLRDALCLPAKWPWPEAFHGAALIRDGRAPAWRLPVPPGRSRSQ